MNPPTILFYLLMALWFLSELYYKKRLISSKDDKKGKDKSTLNLLWIVIVLSIILANFSANIFLNAKIINHNWIVYCGLLFVFTGIFLRLVIIKSLGKYFTVDVTIKEHHELKKDGFYKIIRHPSYAMSLLTFLGLGLSLNNWAALLIAFIPPFFAFSYRIKIEENVLANEFGQEYTEYRKQTKKLIPFVY